MENKKICFVSDANQENYIKQFNSKIENLPEDFDFIYYVCTNIPDMITNKYDKLKIFSLSDLQKRDEKTIEYEVLEKGVNLFKYPANIRRHIINKAFEDGFDYVVWNDCDVQFSTTKELFLIELEKFKINNIYTQNSIYRFGNGGNQAPFGGCDIVLKDFKSEDKKTRLKIHDGPTAVYYFDKETQKNYIKSWDEITLYGYQKPYSYQRGAERPPAEVYAVAFNNIDILHTTHRCFIIRHDNEIKY